LEDNSIGEGGFSIVWKVRHKITHQIYAIKIINKDNIIKQCMVDQVNRELEIMYKLNHPYIIKLYSHFEDDEDLCLIMEIASKGQLYSSIKRLKHLNQRTAAQYMREIISAVKYLHTQNPPIIHRDIKPENILLDQEGRCKLADFGWSKFNNDTHNNDSICGTLEYLAPEIVNNLGHDEKVDIWDLGILLFEMLTGRTPFHITEDKNEIFNSIRNLKIVWTDDFPKLARDLVTKILVINPKDRLKLDEILNHQWFKENTLLKPILNPINFNERQDLESHLIQKRINNESDNCINQRNSNNEKVINKLENKNDNPAKEENLVQEKCMSNNIHHGYNLNKSNNLYIDIKNKTNHIKIIPQRLNKSSHNNDLESKSSQPNKIIVNKMKYEQEQKELKDLREEIIKKNNEINELRKALDQKLLELEEITNKLIKFESKNNLIKENHKKDISNNQIIKEKIDELSIKDEDLKTNLLNISYLKDFEKKNNKEVQILKKKIKEIKENYINDDNSNITNDIILLPMKNKIKEIFILISNKFLLLQSKIIEREQKEIDEIKMIKEHIEKNFQSKENENELLNIKEKEKENENSKNFSEDKDFNKNKEIINLTNIFEQRIKLIEGNNKVIEEKFKSKQILSNSFIEKIKLIKESYISYFLLNENKLNISLNNEKWRELVVSENI